MMDVTFIDSIGTMMQNIIEFMMNMSSGFVSVMVVLFVGALMVIIFDNFKRFIIAPKY